MLVTPVPIVAVARLEQRSNALNPMLNTLFGIVILVIAVPANAKSPILVTPEVGVKVIVARLVQDWNA